MFTIYNDYDYTTQDIKDTLDITREPDDDDINLFLDTIYNNAIEDLSYNFIKSPQYIVQATRNTHYPDFYKNNTIGYLLIDNLRDIFTTISSWGDYFIIEYDKTIKVTTIGHDNNYFCTIKALDTHHDKDNTSYEQLEKLYKRAKNIKEN